MCGIVGYIGKNNAVPFLLSGLEKLEYRGYDSSGIAFYTDNKIKVIKKQGRLQVVKDIIKNGPPIFSNIGIGHTRWATHGSPSDVNAHPHVSKSGKIAVVHNGIIENYIKLADDLKKQGVEFKSETDTEVFAQFLDSIYDGDMFKTILKAVNMLSGAFAFAVICSDDPTTLYAVKKDSPLIVGIGKNGNYLASDIPAILSETKTICRVPEKTISVLNQDSFKLYDFNGKELSVKTSEINWDVKSASKNGFEHFMLKEIMEQPKVIDDTILPRITGNKVNLDNIDLPLEYLKNLKKIMIVACGSAYHVGCASKYFMENLTKISVETDLASEFRYRSPIIDQNTLVIVISQSGETADSLAALREAKKLGAKVLAIVNVVGSAIAYEADYVVYTWAGPEIAVATTKAYTAQLAAMYLVSLYIGDKLGNISQEKLSSYIDSIKSISKKIQSLLDNQIEIQNIAKKYYNYEKIFFIGRTLDYAVCMEGSLKLKEISYIHSEAYAAGELKHGTISLIDDNTLVVALATQDDLFDKTISNIRAVKSRGAKILSISSPNYTDKLTKISDDTIYIPESDNMFSPLLSVIPLQILSYHIAKMRGCDIDKPRNLAKSVTVE